MKLPGCDLIPRVSNYCLREWQEIWNNCVNNCNLDWITSRSARTDFSSERISASEKFAFRSRLLLSVMIVDNRLPVLPPQLTELPRLCRTPNILYKLTTNMMLSLLSNLLHTVHIIHKCRKYWKVLKINHLITNIFLKNGLSLTEPQIHTKTVVLTADICCSWLAVCSSLLHQLQLIAVCSTDCYTAHRHAIVGIVI